MKALYQLLLVFFFTSFALSLSAQVQELSEKDTTYSQFDYATGKIEKGKKQGSWLYYKNDIIRRISYFNNDTLVKNTLFFHENGTIKRSVPFKNGKVSGNVCFYSSEGELIAIFAFIDDGYYETVLRRATTEPAPLGHAYDPLIEP